MDEFKFETEDDLKADGFVETVNVFHGGNGAGKIYEKIVEEHGEREGNSYRLFYSVDADGVVAKYVPAGEDAAKVIDVVTPDPIVTDPVAPVVEEVAAEPVAEPEANATDVAEPAE